MGETAMVPAILSIPPYGNGIERLKRVVLSVSSENSRRAYARALNGFWAWSSSAGIEEGFSRFAVQQYRSYLEGRGLAPSTINVHLSALRKLAREANALGLLSTEEATRIERVAGA